MLYRYAFFPMRLIEKDIHLQIFFTAFPLNDYSRAKLWVQNFRPNRIRGIRTFP
jgi:hypothetical protein